MWREDRESRKWISGCGPILIAPSQTQYKLESTIDGWLADPQEAVLLRVGSSCTSHKKGQARRCLKRYVVCTRERFSSFDFMVQLK